MSDYITLVFSRKEKISLNLLSLVLPFHDANVQKFPDILLFFTFPWTILWDFNSSLYVHVIPAYDLGSDLWKNV